MREFTGFWESVPRLLARIVVCFNCGVCNRKVNFNRLSLIVNSIFQYKYALL